MAGFLSGMGCHRPACYSATGCFWEITSSTFTISLSKTRPEVLTHVLCSVPIYSSSPNPHLSLWPILPTLKSGWCLVCIKIQRVVSMDITWISSSISSRIRLCLLWWNQFKIHNLWGYRKSKRAGVISLLREEFLGFLEPKKDCWIVLIFLNTSICRQYLLIIIVPVGGRHFENYLQIVFKCRQPLKRTCPSSPFLICLPASGLHMLRSASAKNAYIHSMDARLHPSIPRLRLSNKIMS